MRWSDLLWRLRKGNKATPGQTARGHIALVNADLFHSIVNYKNSMVFSIQATALHHPGANCDKAKLGLGLELGLGLGSRLGSRVLNNKKIILLTWQDLVLGCNYKTKGKQKKKKEKKSARREKGFT